LPQPDLNLNLVPLSKSLVSFPFAVISTPSSVAAIKPSPSVTYTSTIKELDCLRISYFPCFEKATRSLPAKSRK